MEENRFGSIGSLKRIVMEGTNEERLELYGFGNSTPRHRVAAKFKVFARANFPRYFKAESPSFHDGMVADFVASYYGENVLLTGFRGCAKTSLKKLFDVFVLLNDRDARRRFIKVNTRDIVNSRQIVTDVYNMIIELRWLYGDPFMDDGDTKREESVKSFTTRSGRKYMAGTVGQVQRGHIQDASRPDWVWFEDTEDRDSIRSATVTRNTIESCQESIDGLSSDGSFIATGNHFSDEGVIQWIKSKPSVRHRNIPLLDDPTDDSSSTWPSVFTREKVAAIRRDSMDFFGEYQGDPKRSVNRFFDTDLAESCLKGCRPPISVSAGVRYWGRYDPSHRYGMGTDHADGSGGDSNAMVLIDFTTGEQVASYSSNRISPDNAIREFARVGAEFGNCLIAPESNASCGGVAVTTLKTMGYPRIFRMPKVGKADDGQTDKLGWETNMRTKPTMLFEMRKAWADGLLRINDPDILREMKAYSVADLNDVSVGLATRHFDLLMACCIAWQMGRHSAPVSSIGSYGEAYKAYIGKK